ncbi:hypothetical protein BOTBODRAFT_265937 [Botryobasidium botryosum FD-172 SS1]|uniref:Uncharacterized protein n=1 Tax=Botryobasidium botryosum (strain FD-172 SS1) TaxID=930990 RepID=A0A067MVU7_BOTB1|nr:hypothetical protein BOTBODRAFT_265937 [Botryobasidium botryosum FD-172 SS1]
MGDFTPEKLAQLWPSELATALASPEARTQLPRIALDDRYDAPVRRLAIYIASNEQLCIEAMESDSTVARRAAIGSFARIMGKKSRRPLAWKAIGGTDGFVGLVHRLSTKEVSRLVTAISGRCRKLLGKEDASEVFDDAVLRLLRTSGDTSRTLLPRLWPLLSTTSADAVREILPEMIKSVPTKIYRLAYTHPNTMRAACLSYMKSLYTDAEEVEHLSSLTVCLKDLILSRVPFDWPEAGGSQQGDPGLRFALALLRAYASLIERVPDLASYKDILYPRSATLHEIGALCFDKIGPRDVPALEEFARAITTICRLSSDTTTLFTTSQIPKSSFLRTPVRAWSLDPNERTASLLSSIAFYIPPDSLPPLGPYSAIAPFLDQVPRSQRFSLLRLLCSSTASPLEIDAEKWPPTDDPDLRRSRSIKWDAKILLTFDRESARKAYQASVSVLGNQDALSGNHGYHYRTAMFDGFRRDIEGTIMGAYLRGDESIINQLRTFTTKESAADERAKFLKLTLHTAALFDTDTVFMDTLVWAFGRFTKDVVR